MMTSAPFTAKNRWPDIETDATCQRDTARTSLSSSPYTAPETGIFKKVSKPLEIEKRFS
jgi:hypothetical protein